MRDATVNGKPITASSDAPDTATCPACGSQVRKRKRRNTDGHSTWFYRHADDTNPDCPRRYHPSP